MDVIAMVELYLSAAGGFCGPLESSRIQKSEGHACEWGWREPVNKI